MTESGVELFEVVEVIKGPRTIELEVAGAEGVVVGVGEAEAEGSENSYAVLIEGPGRTVMLWSREIRGTGRRIERSEIYDGASLRVSQRGEVAED